MSYDINFWKLEGPIKTSPVEVYRRLCRGHHVVGLTALPVEDIKARLKAAFSAYDPSGSFPMFSTAGGSIEVSSSTQHFRFDLRGECGLEAQQIVEIMAGFGCPLYDPQVDKRYDSRDGTDLGEVPDFVRPTKGVKATRAAQQAAALQRLRDEALSRIASKKIAPPSKGG